MARRLISVALLFVWAGWGLGIQHVHAEDPAVYREVADFYALMALGRSPQVEQRMSRGFLAMLNALGAQKDQKDRTFRAIQAQAAPNVLVVREVEASEHEMTLQVIGTWTEPYPAEAKGTVFLVKELNSWKIERHQWEPRIRTAPQVTASGVAVGIQDATSMRFPSHQLQGKVMGQPFIPDSALFCGETLIFKQGTNKLEIVLPPGTLIIPGRSVAISAKQSSGRHKVVIYSNGKRSSSLKVAGSSLRLQFGELKDNQLSGYIIVKNPEQNTEVSGYFYVRKK